VPLDRTASYAARLPQQRPLGLRLVSRRHAWYRLDEQPARSWTWRPYPTPRHRFDPAGGGLRVRYFADSPRAAMRERFDAEGRIVSAQHLSHRLVEVTGTLRVLDLRNDKVLDALGLDDQISTSRAPGVWSACQQLTDLVHGWYGDRLHGIVYRSRTTPQRSANLALLAPSQVTVRDLGPLRKHESLLTALVTSDGFAVEAW
jgi:hypothetical protein